MNHKWGVKTMSNEKRKSRASGGGPGAQFQRGVEKPKNGRQTFFRIMSYLKAYRATLLVVIVLILATSTLTSIAPIVIERAIDDFILVQSYEGFTMILVSLSAIYITMSFLSWFQGFLMVGISQKAIKRLREETFNKLQDLQLNFYDQNKAGDLISRVTNDIDNISNTLSNSLIDFITSFLTIIMTITVMFTRNWILTLITIATVPLLFLVVGYIGKNARVNFKAQQKLLGSVNSIITENVNGAKVVQSFSQEKKVISSFKEENDQLRDASIRAQLFAGNMMPVMVFLGNLRYGIVVFSGALLTYFKLATVGQISAFVLFSRQFGQPLNQLAQLYGNIQAALAGAERVFEVLDNKIELVDSTESIEVESFHGDVVFNDVSFSYEENRPVLSNVSFKAKAGQKVALVGPTGAGKTTIINLLSRFYDINSGEIKIDNINIKDIKIDHLRKRVGTVLQDTYLFSGTIKSNLLYGNEHASEDELIQACKLANCHDFITSLPNGYDTKVTGEGMNLSHGQRQLLSIARTLLKDPDLLILDEATSSVDTRTEIKIQEAMKTLMENRTSFIIAHRLSTIRNADLILVINEGRIIEQGTHEELIEKGGMYYGLHASNFETEIL